MEWGFETELAKLEDMQLRLQFGQGEKKQVESALKRLAGQRRELVRNFYGRL